jgi:hypothetical protein
MQFLDRMQLRDTVVLCEVKKQKNAAKQAIEGKTCL